MTVAVTTITLRLDNIFKLHTRRAGRVRVAAPPSPVALLHDRYFLDDLLKVRIHRDLFNGEKLARFLVDRLVDCPIGALSYLVVESKDIFGFARETLFAETQ